MPAVLHQKFPSTVNPRPDIHTFPNARSITRERGSDFRGWGIYTDGVLRVVNGETSTEWGVIARSPHGRIDIMLVLLSPPRLIPPSQVPGLFLTTLLKNFQ